MEEFNFDELTDKEKKSIDKIEKKIKKRMEREQEEKDKKKADKFQEDSNNNEVLRKNGKKVVGRGWRIFCAIMIIFSFLVISGFLAFIGYYVYHDGSLKDSVSLICEKQTCTNTCPEIPTCPSCPTCSACGDCQPVVNVTLEVKNYGNQS